MTRNSGDPCRAASTDPRWRLAHRIRFRGETNSFDRATVANRLSGRPPGIGKGEAVFRKGMDGSVGTGTVFLLCSRMLGRLSMFTLRRAPKTSPAVKQLHRAALVKEDSLDVCPVKHLIGDDRLAASAVESSETASGGPA